MTKSMTTAQQLIPIVAVLLCGGCLDLAEDYHINPDGSFRMKVTLGFADFLLGGSNNEDAREALRKIRRGGEKISERCRADEGITRCDFQEYTEDDLRRFRFDVEGRDFQIIAKTKSTIYMGLRGMFKDHELLTYETELLAQSSIEITGAGGGRLCFVRDFSRTGVIDPLTSEDAMGLASLGDCFIRVKLAAPLIVTSNGKIADDKQSVEWAIPWSETLDDRFERTLKGEFRLDASKR